MAGVQRDRAAELIVEPAGGRQSKHGSGYRVTASTVITAAHVVADAARIRVRFNADLPDEWSSTGTVEFSDAAADVAVVRIVPTKADEHIVSAQFGRVGERAAVVTCTMVGFPRFKVRDDPPDSSSIDAPTRYRDSHQAEGRIASLSNWREGTLEIVVSPPAPDPDPGHSPWEGMSGAAVWSGDYIVGLVTEHFPRDGLNRLAATRTDRWYERVPPDELARLCELTGLSASASELVDVIPAGLAEAIAADYTEQVEAIAPDMLLDRGEELARLAAFCASDETYQWWRAGPWAGKTALAAWLVLHPPVGVIAVSFFVTGRLSGQSDSTAFTEAMIQQLAVVAGEPASLAATAVARDGQRRRLLKQAAFRAQEAGKQLLLVVDGLDEDTGLPPAGASSIASLLPERPPEGVHVLVTSRPHPGVPVDVPGKHPLRNCKVRELAPSPYAEHLEIEAKRELVQHLRGTEPVKVDIIGFIAAAGGGLTLRELVELTGANQPKLEAQLSGVFGRTLSARTARDVQLDRTEELYLFAHETLREMAAEQLAYDLDHYLQRLHAWADRYRDRGWPGDTPRYLLRPYAQVLAATGERARLAAIATDRQRHDVMLKRTLGDAAALAEIADAQQLSLAQKMPDLILLTHLAIEQDRLIGRNRVLPHRLPALWVRLGTPDRGLALARSITDPRHQAKVLAGLALALGAIGEFDRAEQIARSVSSPGPQVWVLGQLAVSHAKSGGQDSARRLIQDAELVASTISDSSVRAEALRGLAIALANTDLQDEFQRVLEKANQVATEIDSGGAVIARTAKALAAAGQIGRADRLIAEITAAEHKADALGQLAVALASAGRFDEADQIASRAAADIADPAMQAGVIDRKTAAVGTKLAAMGRWSEAQKAVGEIKDEALKAETFAGMASNFAAVGRTQDALEAVEAADRAGRPSRPLPGPARCSYGCAGSCPRHYRPCGLG